MVTTNQLPFNQLANKKGVEKCMPAGIKIRDDESIDNALRRFKRSCQSAGIITEMKKREYYEKPSERRRRIIARRKKRF
ncbi:MAG: 30S ribosomal protein S21 [bacterium]